MAAALESSASARLFLRELHRLEPWRGPVETALAELLAAGGAPIEAARLRLAAEGAAAVAPLLAEAKAALQAGRKRSAAELCLLLEAAAPDDPGPAELAVEAWAALGDERAWRRASVRAELLAALSALGEGDGTTARKRLAQARERLAELAALATEPGAPPDGAIDPARVAAAATIELLDAAVDLQRSRVDEANARLLALDPAAVATARARASPLLTRWLALLGAAAPLADAARRLGLRE